MEVAHFFSKGPRSCWRFGSPGSSPTQIKDLGIFAPSQGGCSGLSPTVGYGVCRRLEGSSPRQRGGGGWIPAAFWWGQVRGRGSFCGLGLGPGAGGRGQVHAEPEPASPATVARPGAARGEGRRPAPPRAQVTSPARRAGRRAAPLGVLWLPSPPDFPPTRPGVGCRGPGWGAWRRGVGACSLQAGVARRA